MKTAVTEVLEYFEQFGLTITEENKAKFEEIFKEQIIDAYTDGQKSIHIGPSHLTGQQYYTSTYTTNKETLK